ncbi:MAG: family 10 glycosylhydrolase [Phycisphaerales bacterium]
MASSVRTRVLVFVVLWLLGVVSPSSAGGADSIEDMKGFACSSGHDVQAWTPMAGSPAVSVVSVGGKAAFRMPCNFRGTGIERGSWDHPVEQDLAMCQGVQFLFYCSDPSPVANFVLYLRSGDGWYRCAFDAPAAGRWAPIRVSKTDMDVEGRPAGWSKIDTIRISAWRGQDRDAEFHVTDFALFGGGAKIVIVRGDSAAERAPAEMGAVREYTSVMAGLLERANLPHLVLSDRDITAERLRDAKLVVLPHNPAMPDEIAEEIAGFLRADGTLLACYHLPGKLASLTGIQTGEHVRQPYDGYFASIRPSTQPLRDMPAITRQASWNIQEAGAADPNAHVAAWWYTNHGDSTGKPAIVAGAKCVYLTHVLQSDDPANKLQLLLSMVGHLVPQLWSYAAQGSLDRIGRFGPYDGYESAKQDIARLDAGMGRAGAALARADQCRRRSLSLLPEMKFADAIAAAEESRQALLEAYCLAQQPLPAEHRAFWCHSAFGVAGMSWEEAIKQLADNGFTAILPNMLWGGVAFYRSSVLPAYKDLEVQGDQIERCVEACKRYGVECHVWKVNYNMGGATDDTFVQQMRSLGRVQVGYDGSVNERWLCPSHPENQKLEIAAMLEVARQYDVDGLHFDYIRYPDRDGCFCEGCRNRFEDTLAKRIDKWPSDTREDPELARKWLDFRRRQITLVVAEVAAQARQIRPGIKISAAVFGNWVVDRDGVGQDWKLWCEKGYLDFVCPMDYFSSSATFERAVVNQREWAGTVPCYPGIGLSVWKDPADIARLIEQIGVTRRLKTGGFTVFNYGPREARDVLPLLGKGPTRVEK